jgi:hypothetical protein
MTEGKQNYPDNFSHKSVLPPQISVFQPACFELAPKTTTFTWQHEREHRNVSQSGFRGKPGTVTNVVANRGAGK